MIQPWEIDKMLAARHHAERCSDTMLDRILSKPQQVRNGFIKIVSAAAGLVILGWILGRK